MVTEAQHQAMVKRLDNEIERMDVMVVALHARVAELEAALTHWKGNAYRASDKCEALKDALERVMETAPPDNEAWHIARRALYP